MRSLCCLLASLCWRIAGAPKASCSYKNVDFAPLNTAGGHSIAVPQGTLHINPCETINLCNTLTDPAGQDSTCCLQTNFTPSTIVSCGVKDKHEFTTNLADENLQIGMIQKFGTHCGYILDQPAQLQVSIAFECDESTPDPGVLTYVDSGLYCNLNITWKTKSACKLPPAPNRPSSLANDWGMHFLLMFAATVLTYCGLGTFIKSRLPNHSDACYNNIPQRDFWFDLHNLVADGAVYAASMGARTAKKQGTYEAIDSETYGSADNTDVGASEAEPKE